MSSDNIDNVRRLPPRRKPMPEPAPVEQSQWLCEQLGIEYDEQAVERASKRLQERLLWLPTAQMPSEPVMLIEHLLEAEQRLLVFGPEKSMKTSLVAHLAIAVASGHDLFGYGDFRVPKGSRGPVIIITGEGGKRYALDRLDRVCALYGVNRRSLDVLVIMSNDALDSPQFLIGLDRWVAALNPRIVLADPLYLMSPAGWNGSQLTDFKVAGYSALCEYRKAVPGIAHHDKRGEGIGLRKASGAGPAEWCGQWWGIRRLEDFDGATHKLSLGFGGRAVGAGRWNLTIDDRTLDVAVTPTALGTPVPAASGTSSKPSVSHMVRSVLSDAFGEDEDLSASVLWARVANELQSQYGHDTKADSLRRGHADRLVESKWLVRSADSGAFSLGPDAEVAEVGSYSAVSLDVPQTWTDDSHDEPA